MLLDQTQGTEMERLWNLLGELSSQLSHNRQQTEELHRRADELRNQAVHSQTGFTLRRFNVEISQEEFDSELEKLNVSLVIENQQLQSENRQLTSLLKDYESTLEAVMSKFRSFAHSSQLHDLELTRHYENLLLSLPIGLPPPPTTPPPGPQQQDDTKDLHTSLSHLANLIRKAMRSLQGEDPEELEGQEDSFVSNHHSRSSSFSSSSSVSSYLDPSSGGYISKKSTSQPLYIPTTSTSSLIQDDNDDDEEEAQEQTQTEGNETTISSSGKTNNNKKSTSSLFSDTTITAVRRRDNNHDNDSDFYEQEEEVDDQEDDIELTRFLFKQQKTFDKKLKSRGLYGNLDEALLREIQVEALRKENFELKKLLGINHNDNDNHHEEQVGGGVNLNNIHVEKEGNNGTKDEGEEEEEEETTTRRRKQNGGLLFESGAKPETLDDDDEDENLAPSKDGDAVEKDTGRGDEVKMSKEDEALFQEFFGEPLGKEGGKQQETTNQDDPLRDGDQVEQTVEEKQTLPGHEETQ